MSKIATDFMKTLAKQQEQQESIAKEPEENASEIQPNASESDYEAVEEEKNADTAQDAEEDVLGDENAPEQENEDDRVDNTVEQTQRTRQQMGRPSSLPEGVKRERVMVTMSEVDKEALRLYQETTSGARDRSEIVRAAMAAYIPENIYAMADMMVKMKHKA